MVVVVAVAVVNVNGEADGAWPGPGMLWLWKGHLTFSNAVARLTSPQARVAQAVEQASPVLAPGASQSGPCIGTAAPTRPPAVSFRGPGVAHPDGPSPRPRHARVHLAHLSGPANLGKYVQGSKCAYVSRFRPICLLPVPPTIISPPSFFTLLASLEFLRPLSSRRGQCRHGMTPAAWM